MKTLLFVSFCVILVFNGCIKPDNEPSFPLPTQTGQNILACKINGESHIYKFKPSAINARGVLLFTYSTPLDTGIHLSAISENKDGMFFYVAPLAPIPGLNYQMKIGNISGRTSLYYRDNENNQYVADTNRSSIVFTRFDENVASGKFQFLGINSLKDTVIFTEGWFDITRE